ncbi:MAG: hypothetical protein ACPG5B_09140 [Chitinophagales bacterium]
MLTLEYDVAMENIYLDKNVSEEVFKKFDYTLNQTSYHIILGKLFYYKEKLELNDWLYYLLVKQCSEAMFKDKTESYRILFCWFMLNKTGYKAQLNYLNDEIILSVFTKDVVYDIPVREYDNGYFVDITSYEKPNFYQGEKYKKVNYGVAVFHTCNITNPHGRDFSFKMEKLPSLGKPEIITRELAFIHENELYTVDIDINLTIIQLMHNYPELTIQDHASIPLSNEASNTLLKQLGEYIKGKNKYEAVRFLLSFTRQAMKYKTDQQGYGISNLTFCAEETLYYNFSDCEDRSILFNYLVDQLLDIDVLLLDYPEHATTAVELEKVCGNPIEYDGKNYTICDPTGPGNHLRPGEYPLGLDPKAYTILNKGLQN